MTNPSIIIQRVGSAAVNIGLSPHQYDTSKFPAGAAFFPSFEGQMQPNPIVGTAGGFGLWSYWCSTNFFQPCDGRFGGSGSPKFRQLLATQINPWGCKNFFGLASNPTAFGAFQSSWPNGYNIIPGNQGLTRYGSRGFGWFSGTGLSSGAIFNSGLISCPPVLIDDINGNGEGGFNELTSNGTEQSVEAPCVLYDAFGKLKFHFSIPEYLNIFDIANYGYYQNGKIWDIDLASIYAGAQCYVSCYGANCSGFVVNPETANCLTRYNGPWQAWNVYQPVRPVPGQLEQPPMRNIFLSDPADNADFISLGPGTGGACNVPSVGFAVFSSNTGIMYIIKKDFTAYFHIDLIPSSSAAETAMRSEIGFDLNGNFYAQYIGVSGTMPLIYSSLGSDLNKLLIPFFGPNSLNYNLSATMFDCTPKTIRKRLW